MNIGRTDSDGNFARNRILHRVNRSPAQSDCLCACFWHIDVGVRTPSTEPDLELNTGMSNDDGIIYLSLTEGLAPSLSSRIGLLSRYW